MDNTALDNRTRRLLNTLPPLLDGYEAIAVAIAEGDINHAFWLARRNSGNAKSLSKDLREVYQAIDRKRRARG